MRMKLFSAMVILSALFAAPALAQEYRYYGGAPYP